VGTVPVVAVASVVVLINASAGLRAGVVLEPDALASAFDDVGVKAAVDVVDPQRIPSTVGILWAGADRPDAVIVAGGDGTVSHAAAAVVGTDVVLGVLPIGMFNHFAQQLGIPLDLGAAVRALAAADAVAVDVGEVNGRTFVNQTVLGTDPKLLQVMDRIQTGQGWGRIRSALAGSVRVMGQVPTSRVDLQAPGGVSRRGLRTPLVLVGNGSHRRGITGATALESLTDGALDLTVARSRSRWALVEAGWRAARSGSDALPEIDTIAVPELTITARSRTVRVGIDGEAEVLRSPLRFRVRHQALHVLVPPGPTAGA